MVHAKAEGQKQERQGHDMDSNQEKITIPKVVYRGDDKKLTERIRKFKAGTMRIVIFTIVGMILGWYSYTYYTDSFFITKIILAIPYKLSEAIYVSIIGTNAEQLMLQAGYPLTEFFPQSPLATFLAEQVTPVLIGGAIYGALGYFTGDKRVFTLQRFVKFFGIWCAVILLYIGSVYAVNAVDSKREPGVVHQEKVQEMAEPVENVTEEDGTDETDENE